jgi:hypothetical protein
VLTFFGSISLVDRISLSKVNKWVYQYYVKKKMGVSVLSKKKKKSECISVCKNKKWMYQCLNYDHPYILHAMSLSTDEDEKHVN